MIEGVPLLLVVAAALIEADGRVLVQQRPLNRSLPGLWEFPGGKIEAGETPEQALVRELAEELGVAIDPALCVPTAFASAPLDGRHLIMLLYVVRGWHGDPQPLDATELRWATIEELRRLDMPPADVPLVEALAGLI